MGKLKVKAPVKSSGESIGQFFDPQTFDPALTSLFTSSAGPVKPAQKRSSPQISLPRDLAHPSHEPGTHAGEKRKVNDVVFPTQVGGQDIIGATGGPSSAPGRKRKRKVDDGDDDSLESRYLQRVGRREPTEETQGERRVLQRQRGEGDRSPACEELSSTSDARNPITPSSNEKSATFPPQHESLSQDTESVELEKASRTVFLGNVSTMAIKSKTARATLVHHLESFIRSLPEGNISHKLESIRFRSTAFSNNGLPKKAAYAKKELMDSTTKSTNAYAVYTTQAAAREAVTRLNGTVILDRHLRVDRVAHPAKVDHRRCVFVGNLGFVDDESAINAAKDEENNRPARKARGPADAEEGLWRQFSKAGIVESVRVIRDKATRVGKGFAYVQFQDPNSVEKALLFNEKKFPPMLPRILRVSRAKRFLSNASRTKNNHPKNPAVTGTSGIYQPKLSSKSMSLSGRAKKLLGNAGAAQLSMSQRVRGSPRELDAGTSIPATKVVFEGHRASSKQDRGVLKLGGSGKKGGGKPRTRSSRRGAAFKASGRKKAGKS